MDKTGVTVDLIEADVSDHYRTYDMLERHLHTPRKLAEQLAFQLEPTTQQFLIEKFVGYVVDAVVDLGEG